MAAVLDDYMDSPMDNDNDTDDVFPCKGCGEILEEGKAFELGIDLLLALVHMASSHAREAKPSIISRFHPANAALSTAGNRWHLDCFRCHTCNTLLDSDDNLLLLGDGSLICNNCTYSCSACGNKIEELAILTGDQAFCATCFRCRNCKRKIENLRYARTSQGIFCMSCHESLMARRRKKSKAAAQAKSREKDGSPMITDKSLPALPPNAIPPNAFSDTRVDPDSDTPTELSPRPRPAYKNESSSRGSSRPSRSPERSADAGGKEGQGLGLPPASYRNNRNSVILPGSNSIDSSGGDDGFFIPVALDPTPAASSTPRSSSNDFGDVGKRKDRDYFSVSRTASQKKKTESQGSTPHIAFQEKGRQSSSDLESMKLPLRNKSVSSRNDAASSTKPSPSVADRPPRTSSTKLPGATEEFKLQDAPKSKKVASGRSAGQSPSLTSEDGSAKGVNGATRRDKDSFSTESPPRPSLGDRNGDHRSSIDSRRRDGDEPRPSLDSRNQSRPDITPSKPISRKELPQNARHSKYPRKQKPSVAKSTPEDLSSSASSLARPPMAEHKLSDSYMQPRAPPPPPTAAGQAQAQAQAQAKEQGHLNDNKQVKPSPGLPRWSSGGDFSMDEDMARILGTDEGSSSILRRVSNAVRHGRTNSIEASHPQNHRSSGHARSVSETTRGTVSPRWPKTPVVMEDGSPSGHAAAHSISSPISLHSNDDPAFLKRQLRNSEQKVAELERQFSAEKDIKNLNKKLIEKRKTVSTLDTQTEIMIRQLEVLAGYVERAKATKAPIDPRDLEESAFKDFVQKLEQLKDSMSESIEELVAERDDLIDEKNQAMADRDRALLEFEQLSSKNAQLADMNNDLTHQIQERFKSQIGDIKSPGGLGIYSHKGVSGSTSNLADSASITTATTLMPHESDEHVAEARPTVVDIRKGQAKKFNWKKGSKTVAQNIAKGVNRTVGAFQQERELRHQGLSGENIGMPYNMTVAQVESPATPGQNGQNRHQQQAERQGFGFFKKNTMPKSMSTNNLSTTTVAAEAPSTLFGSELMDRADYERRQIPCVVTRCIEEVELRGMDIEGIYRKTGGNSQVKMIQEGFDKSEDYDISDPELDITAVTSVLKQYFRKLPTPLLTYDVYDRVLESNAIADPNERCEFLRRTFASMPQSHSDCLEFLMFHLTRVAKREPENLMSPKNLAVVFAPTIMRDTSLEREMSDMHSKNLAVQFIVENSSSIFTD
ncbi:rho-type GTPase-activating protein [Plectosphaerella plurivora]|uniref:Rho-type GTPase-activating protein n=1 Tax=Plectosphaerella plurivora TaxID=936078 RepID=A0A9P8V6W9_9PEZI|nr:rho-type GTPase-activating protein [Plectosphaerella plurivora]